MGALLILAGGVTCLQVAGNPYVAVLGHPATSSSRLLLTQASNSLGSTIAPYFGGVLILSNQQITADDGPAVIACRAACISDRTGCPGEGTVPGNRCDPGHHRRALILFRLPPIPSSVQPGNPRELGSAWHHRHLILGAGGIFLAVGAEVAIGSFLVSFLTQPDILGISAKQAATLVSLYWGGSMMGRFTGSAVMRTIRASTVLGVAAVIVMCLLATSLLSAGVTAAVSTLCIGFFNSIMFPSIFTLGIAQLGPLTSKGSGILMASAVGRRDCTGITGTVC